MNPCIDAVKAAAGDLDDRELAEIFETLRGRAKELMAREQSLSMEDATLRAADELQKQAKQAALIEKRNALINLRRRAEVVSFIRTNFADRPDLGFESLLVGTNLARKGSRLSVAAEQKTLGDAYIGGMLNDLAKDDLLALLSRGDSDLDIADALWKIGKGEDTKSLNPDVVKIASIIQKYQEASRIDANRAGASIGKLEGYITRQSHDGEKIETAGFDKWVSDILPKLDQRTFDAMPKLGEMEVELRSLEKEAADTSYRDKLARDYEKDGFSAADAGRKADKSMTALQDSIVRKRTELTAAKGGGEMAVLRAIYSGLVSGDHLKSATVAPTGFKGPSNIAKKMSQERVLHFKDGVAWHEYNKLYGTGSLRESILSALDMAGQNTALMRRLGTNPEVNLNMAMDIVAEDIRKAGDDAALKNFNLIRSTKLENRFKEVSGQTRIPGNASQARVAANVRAWQSMSKLGGALLSSFTDLPVAASEMRYQGKNFLGSLAEMAGGLAKGRGSQEQKQILSSFGVYADSMRGEIIRRFSADDSTGGKTSRMMNHFFRLNGLSWWTDANKASAGLMMSNHLAQNRSMGWDKMNPNLQRSLSLYDIDAKKWDLLRNMELKHADGRDYMTADGIADIPDEALEGYLKGSGLTSSKPAIREVREGLQRSLRSYVNDRVAYAVLEPDARTRSIMNQGTQPGTVPGDLLRFVTQFKSFPAAYMQKTMGRELYGRGYAPTPLGVGYRGSRDFLSAMKNGNGEKLALAQLIVWTTAFGYLSMTAKDAVKGREPRPVDKAATWGAAFTQGGGIGIMGDFFFGQSNRFGNSALETAAGPVIGTGSDMINLWNKARAGDDAASSALRLGFNNTPFLNLFYTRIMLDHLVLWSFQEALNPGSLRRTEQTIREQNNQEFLIRPSQSYLDPLGITR